MPVESYEDDDEEQEGPRSSFGTYLAEGDALFKQSEYKKALESYSLALELQPNDKTCLVARSKCYLKLGDPQKALQDAEDALTEDKEFNKGLYRKAEALYCMGDFEYALMYYHRGHKLRPELDEFRLGIQKAQEAIDNSIGSAAKIKLENKGDLSFFTKQDDIGNKKRAGYLKPTTTKKLKPLANRNKEVKPLAPSKKTVKQLLGELYSDKEYFEKLMEDEAFIKSRQNNPIYELVQGGLNYLETRTEFWRQQKPLYARKKEKAKFNVVRKKAKPSISKYVLKQLEEIDQALSSGDPDRSLRLAQKLLKSVEGMNKEDLPNKAEVVANIHSCIGNAYIEMDQLTKALRHHDKDLQLSRQSKLVDGESRALDNVGRVHARMGNFKKAVESWNLKLPLVKASLESTWLCHEIGRCHLELGNNQSAKEFGKKSLSAGKDCEDQVWQLNATVLIAQSEVKLGEVDDAIETFSNALELAIGLGDSSAQAAISKALSELQRRSSQSRRSHGSPGRTSQASGQYLSQSDDEGSPRIKSDMDKHSDVEVSPPVSRSSERSNAEEGGDESNEEGTGDEIESDAIYDSNQDKDDNTEANDVLPTEGDNENKDDGSELDVNPRASSGDDVTPRNESEVDESSRDEGDANQKTITEDADETSAGEGEVQEGSHDENSLDESKADEPSNTELESEGKSNIGSENELTPRGENDVADASVDEGNATENAGGKDTVENVDQTAEGIGNVETPDVGIIPDDGAENIEIGEITEAEGTAEDATIADENVASTAEIVTSTTEPVTSTTEPVASNAENVASTTENVASTTENVASNNENVASTTENITSTTEPVTTTTENATVTTESVASEITLPDTTTAENESTEEVSSVNETTDNTSPVVEDNVHEEESPRDLSEVSNAEELPLDSSRVTPDVTTPEVSPRDTSVVETTSGNDTEQTHEEVSSTEEIPGDTSLATLVSTTDEITQEISEASLESSASEEIPPDSSVERAEELSATIQEVIPDLQQIGGETTSPDESSSKYTVDESSSQDLLSNRESGDENTSPSEALVKETSEESLSQDEPSKTEVPEDEG